MILKSTYYSPFGKLLIEANEEFLLTVIFDDSKENDFKDKNSIIDNCSQQLDEYFKGKRVSFDLPLKLAGTDFQKEVWGIVSNIPKGKTVSYKNIAQELDNIGAIRAIGKANGDNKFHLIIPCHRVIGSDGSLTGYAGGLAIKERLLIFEEAIANHQLSFSFSK